MNREHLPQNEGGEQRAEGTQAERLRARNQMEIMLCARHYGFEEVQDVLPRWIDEFGNAFGRIVEEKPEFLERFLVDDEDVLGEVEEILYEAKKV